MDEYIQNIKNNFDKYIIIYYDKDYDDDINNLINDSKLELFKIIIFYKKMYIKKYNSQRIIEILYDDFSEKVLLEKSYSIILFNQGSDSIILNNFIRERDDIENGVSLFFNKKIVGTFSKKKLFISAVCNCSPKITLTRVSLLLYFKFLLELIL
jgi:hypothetical protein